MRFYTTYEALFFSLPSAVSASRRAEYSSTAHEQTTTGVVISYQYHFCSSTMRAYPFITVRMLVGQNVEAHRSRRSWPPTIPLLPRSACVPGRLGREAPLLVVNLLLCMSSKHNNSSGMYLCVFRKKRRPLACIVQRNL